MDFKTEMAERTAQIEQIIKKYLPKEEGYQKTIMEAMNYSVLAGGKRLRPMLMQETYRLFGGRSSVWRFCSSVACIRRSESARQAQRE